MKTAYLVSLIPAFAGIAFTQTVPSLMNYQGRLANQLGAPLPTGNYAIQFRLWDSTTNGTGLIWGQQQNVSVQGNGIFNVILGAPGGTLIPGATITDLALAFGSSSRFLGMTLIASNGVLISGATEILPRQQILTVPYA